MSQLNLGTVLQVVYNETAPLAWTFEEMNRGVRHAYVTISVFSNLL